MLQHVVKFIDLYFIIGIHRQRDKESASFADLAFRPNPSVVCLYHLTGDCQTQAGASVVSGAGGFHPVKPVKYMGQMFWRNALSRIRDTDKDMLFIEFDIPVALLNTD